MASTARGIHVSLDHAGELFPKRDFLLQAPRKQERGVAQSPQLNASSIVPGNRVERQTAEVQAKFTVGDNEKAFVVLARRTTSLAVRAFISVTGN